LSVAGVDSFLTARCGDARNSPPWPQPKSLAAAPLVVSKQALSLAGQASNEFQAKGCARLAAGSSCCALVLLV